MMVVTPGGVSSSSQKGLDVITITLDWNPLFGTHETGFPMAFSEHDISRLSDCFKELSTTHCGKITDTPNTATSSCTNLRWTFTCTERHSSHHPRHHAPTHPSSTAQREVHLVAVIVDAATVTRIELIADLTFEKEVFWSGAVTPEDVDEIVEFFIPFRIIEQDARLTSDRDE